MNFIQPCEGVITSPFGMRKHPVTGKPSTMHWGIDIAKVGSVPVVAVAGGKVSRVQKDGTFGTYGNLVMIEHVIKGHVIETVYAHLKSFDVKLGQEVKQGEKIGFMGNTGGSTGQHLHFEIHEGRWNNKYSNAKDPVAYLKNSDKQEPLKKEEIVLFDSGSSTLNKEVVATIVAARKAGVLSSDTYVLKAKNGTLTLQELTAINTLILNRAYLDKPSN